MTLEIKAPTFPESIANGTVAAWHKQPGEAAKRDEVLVEIETDKVVLEIVAPADGTLRQIVKAVGDTVLSRGGGRSLLPEGGTATSPTPAEGRSRDSKAADRVGGEGRCARERESAQRQSGRAQTRRGTRRRRSATSTAPERRVASRRKTCCVPQRKSRLAFPAPPVRDESPPSR